MKLRVIYFALLSLLMLISCSAGSRLQQGKVIGVKDGDTIEMLIDLRNVTVRLEGIDCPEKGQAFGNKAKEFTSGMVYGKSVKIQIKSYDQFKRALGVIFLPDGRVLNEELLKAGMAWHFKKYNTDQKWARLESQARQSGIGLWSDSNAVAPWEFRKNRRKG